MSRFWGPMFPDMRRPARTVEAAQSVLSLETPVTNSGNLDFVVLRARVAGLAGDDISVEFTDDAITADGELDEDTILKTVHVKFSGDETTLDQLFTLLSVSELIEMTGSWSPSAVMAAGDDEFAPTALDGGRDAHTTHTTFWGPHFPDHPDEAPPVLPTAPSGAATLALALEAGATMTMTWSTGIHKANTGVECRAANLDYPQVSFSGSAYLIGEDVATQRANLQRFAAQGQAFQLALPWEGIGITGPMTGTTLTVSDTTLSDWAVPGQRVVVTAPESEDGRISERVIQSVTPTTIVLESMIGAELCDVGSVVMPTVAVLLDPQQAFQRYPTEGAVEQWQIDARAEGFGFPSAAVPSRLALEGLATSGVLDGVVLLAKTAGVEGNAVTVELSADALSGVEIVETATTVHVKFEGDVTTVGELAAAIASASDLVRITGTWTDSDVLATADDEFGPTLMTGGVDALPSTMGVGATLTTFAGLAVWDRGSDVSGGATDQMHSMIDIAELGAAPFAVGGATMPDWGRHVAFARDEADEHQWLKALIAYAHGRAITWWLPTFRADLLAVENGPAPVPGSLLPALREGVIVIDSDVGEIATWFPLRYRYLLVEQADESTFLCEVKTVTDNLDGTTELVVEADPDEPAARLPVSAEIIRLSWLELCRFEDDEAKSVFHGVTMAISEVARVVQR